MNNVVSLHKPGPVTFDVQVTHAIAQDADDCTMWVAECNGPHLVTESETYEGLVARVWEIAPEMAQENGLNVAPDALRLRFIHVDSVPQRLASGLMAGAASSTTTRSLTASNSSRTNKAAPASSTARIAATPSA